MLQITKHSVYIDSEAELRLRFRFCFFDEIDEFYLEVGAFFCGKSNGPSPWAKPTKSKMDNRKVDVCLRLIFDD